MSKCSNCGTDVADNAKFCFSCGQPMPVEAAPSEAPAAAPAAEPAPTPAPAQNTGDCQQTGQTNYQQYNQQSNNGGYQAQGGYQQQQNYGYQAQGGYQQQQNYGYQNQNGYQQPHPNAYAPRQNMIPEEDKNMGIAAYITSIGFLIAYLGTDNAPRSQHVIFHLNQAFVLFLFWLPAAIPLLGWLWGVFMLICWIIALVGAASGEMRPVPLLGQIKIIKH